MHGLYPDQVAGGDRAGQEEQTDRQVTLTAPACCKSVVDCFFTRVESIWVYLYLDLDRFLFDYFVLCFRDLKREERMIRRQVLVVQLFYL